MDQKFWNLVEEEELTTTMVPGNPEEDKFAVAIKKEILGGHLPKGKKGRFAKTIFYFLRSCCSSN